jgi:hypothetical protein
MQNKKNTKKYVSGFVGLAVLATLAVAVPAMAATTTTAGTPSSAWAGHAGGMHGTMKPGVFGTVSAVSGNIITVTSTHRMGPRPTTGSLGSSTTGDATASTTPISTTYTVDATNATITKNNVAGTIGSIAVGDTIMAQGTLTGTNLVATTVRDGVMTRTPGVNGQSGKTPTPMTSPITGNGQPVIAGIISSISGNSVVITNKSNVTYTVDVTNAKIVQGQSTVTVSNLAVGDNVFIQGTINGNSVTASSVIDQKAPSTTTTGTTTTQSKGFFGSIGSFFSHLFGF